MSEQLGPGLEPGLEPGLVVAYSHEAIELALRLWRDGYKQSTRVRLPEAWRAEYDQAVQRVLAELQRLATMQELVTWYYHEPPEMDALLDELMQAPSGRLLNYSVIEDAAYWRRARQLVPDQVREE
jgi:hypothetical protein